MTIEKYDSNESFMIIDSFGVPLESCSDTKPRSIEVSFKKDSIAHNLLSKKEGPFQFEGFGHILNFKKYSVTAIPSLDSDPKDSIRYHIEEIT
jgi:hypothetical protein